MGRYGGALVLLLAAVAPSGAASPGPPHATPLPTPAGKTNHGPAAAELSSGTLLACWYSASAEASPDAVILCARSGDAGASWSPASVAVASGDRAAGAREANKSLGNVVLFPEAPGRLWMVHGVIQRWDVPPFGTLCTTWRCGRVDARLSGDEGRNWSEATRLDDRVGALPRGGVLRHPALGLLLPLYLEGAETAGVRAFSLVEGRPALGPWLAIPTQRVIQPTLVLQRDGAVRAFLRDPTAVAVRTAVLDPVTRQWSAAVPTDLPNPGSAVEAFAAPDGRFVVLHNPSRHERAALRMSASLDGTHFAPGCDLVPPGREGAVAYPSVIRTTDGDWHVVWSAAGKRQIRHARFDAAWLRACLGG